MGKDEDCQMNKKAILLGYCCICLGTNVYDILVLRRCHCIKSAKRRSGWQLR